MRAKWMALGTRLSLEGTDSAALFEMLLAGWSPGITGITVFRCPFRGSGWQRRPYSGASA